MLKKELEKIDTKLMYKTYDSWPEIAKESFSKYNPLQFDNFSEIVFIGMGGSGAINEFFAAILSQTNIHVSIVKGYHLPKTIGKNTLLVFTSVSGNTIETLSVLKLAIQTDSKIIVFSSGGKIEKICKNNNLEFRKIPMYNSPRASFPSYIYSMLRVLKNFFPIKDEDITESFELLEKVRKNIFSENLNSNNISLNLAKWLDGIPLIYYPWGLEVTAVRFKNSLQENSKMHAMAEEILEASHNGIVGWEKTSNVKSILIQGTNDFIKTKERYKIIKDYFNENNIDFFEIFSEKGKIIGKLICLIYVLDYATIYKSVLNNIDPTPVKSIDYVKSKLVE